MLMRILTITGISILVILFAFWAYLLLFGAPKSVNDIFTDLGLTNGPTDIVIDSTENQTTELANNENKLVQLSTKSLAGFVYLPPIIASSTSTSSPEAVIKSPAKLRYAERGTGHVYEVDLGNNTETRISGTTVGKTIDAIFSSNGDYVALISENGDNTKTNVYGLGIGNKVKELPDNSYNVTFIDNSTVNYSLIEGGITSAYSYSFDKNNTTKLWDTALQDIDIIWTANGTYVVNKPTPWLKSGIYRVSNNGSLTRVVAPQYSLTAVINPDGNQILYRYFDTAQKIITSRLLDLAVDTNNISTLVAIPEKCTFIDNKALCAKSFALENNNRESLNNWYRGEIVSNDTLWQDRENGSAILLDKLSDLAGFDIDVINLTHSPDNKTLFFINKINDTLWTYHLN